MRVITSLPPFCVIAILAIAIPLAGCTTLGTLNPGNLFTYHAYGDSITGGAGLTDSANQEYAELIAHQFKLTLADHAYAGDQACDVPTRQIFPNVDNPTLSSTLYTLLISTNDVDVKGAGPYEAVFNLCHQASIAWVALPTQFKVLAASSAVTTSGPGHLESANNWDDWTTDAANSSITFPVQLSVAGPVYAWYRIIDGNTGTFTWSIDQTLTGSATTATTPAIATQNRYNNSIALLRLPHVSAGAHTITFTQTSSAPAGMGILAVGVPPPTRTSSFPRILVGTTPRQLMAPAGSAACASSQTPCLAYIADITANVALIAGDGLDVELFTTGKYMQGTTVDMIDSVHPNALGHTEITHAITDVLN